MQWLELSIQTCPEGIDLLAAELTALGYDSFIIDDEADFRNFLENNRQYWDYVDEALENSFHGVSQIRLFLPDGADAPDRLSALHTQLDALKRALPDAPLGSLQIRLARLRDEDWANSWKQYYQPLSIGQRLLVVPRWLSPENPEGRIPVILDPGMIFGTGAHASTRMCLEALEELISGGEQVLDLGSGSGILSIAALRLGAARAVGVDIDEKAEDIARENAACNGLGPERFTALTGNVLCDLTPIRAAMPDGCDLLLANIVADVIIPLAPLVRQLTRPGGLLLCSGILNTRVAEVEQALSAAGLTVRGRREQDDWFCLVAAPNC